MFSGATSALPNRGARPGNDRLTRGKASGSGQGVAAGSKAGRAPVHRVADPFLPDRRVEGAERPTRRA